jgi:hypothetical protein
MRHSVSRVGRLTRLLVLGAAVLFAGGVSAAAPPDKPEKGKKQKPQQVVPTGAEDSALPAAADALAEQALEQMTSRSTEGLQPVEHADGTISVDLEGRFMSIVVATPTASGGHSVSCATGRHARDQVRKASAGLPTEPSTAPVTSPAPAPLEEK